MINKEKIMKNTTRNKDLWKKRTEKLRTNEFTGGLRMYKKPQPIVLKGWAVTNDFSY